tara:strand:- start:6299 stop:7573 length:1275 start_codon:yes stop_codon:yes gene_type:complete
MTPWTLIKQLEKDNSRLYKEDLLEKYIDDPILQQGLLYALNPLTTFGVKQIPISDTDGPGLEFSEFALLLNALKTRGATGNAAKDAIEEKMQKATVKQWNDWYRRIILKDLKCGVSEKTVNKIAKKKGMNFEIPIFGCMLASDGLKHENKMVGENILEYKFDGVRVIGIVVNNVCTLYSRNGKEFPNFPHIQKALSKPEYEGLVFDGEVMSEDFQTLMKQVYRKSDVQTDDAYLALFDILPFEEWNNGISTLTQIERKKQLNQMEFDECIHRVGYIEANLDDEEGQLAFKNLNKDAIEKGYEGIMVKPANGLYECKRSKLWLKIKPFIEVTLTVVDIEEGTGKYQDCTGALVCEGTDAGTFIEVNVGSGLADKDRADIWENKEKVLGQLVEIRADSITENQDGTFSLRFPRFKTFRGFNIGEKI